jgi:hypothetical protein
MQGHLLRFAAVHGPLGGGTSGVSHRSSGGGSAADAGPRSVPDLTDFGNEGKVEVICPIEHSLSLAAVAERLKRETAEGIHRVA